MVFDYTGIKMLGEKSSSSLSFLHADPCLDACTSGWCRGDEAGGLREGWAVPPGLAVISVPHTHGVIHPLPPQLSALLRPGHKSLARRSSDPADPAPALGDGHGHLSTFPMAQFSASSSVPHVAARGERQDKGTSCAI